MAKKQIHTASVQETPSFSFSKHYWAWILAIIAFFLYLSSTKFQYAYDDDVYVLRNAVTQQGLGGISDIFGKGSVWGFSKENFGTYRPLTLLTFALEKTTMGEFSPKVSHFINVLLYALGIFFLVRLLMQWFQKSSIAIPLLIAGLFLAHPLHTEVVANVKSRDELLAFLFGILMLSQVSDYIQTKQFRTLLLGGFYFLLACFSKENALTLLGIIPLMLYLGQENRSWKEILSTSAYMTIPVLLYLICRFAVLEDGNVSNSVLNNGIFAATNAGEKWAMTLGIWGKYLRLCILPFSLSYDYSYSHFPVIDFADPHAWGSLLGYLLILIGGIWFTIQRKMIGFGLLWYLITFSIVSNLFVDMSATLAERFMFLPSLGICIAVGGVIDYLLEKKASLKGVGLGIMGGIIACFLFFTIQRIPVWENNYTLFEDGVKTAPNSFRTWINLAEILRVDAEREQKDVNKRNALFKKAIDAYHKSLAIYNQNNPETWYNLGVCFQGLNNAQGAYTAYSESLKKNPKHVNAANNLGVIHFQKKEYDQALSFFEKAYSADSTNGNALANLGAVYYNLNDPQKSIRYLEKSLKYSQYNPNLYANLARSYNAIGDSEKAQFYQAKVQK